MVGWWFFDLHLIPTAVAKSCIILCISDPEARKNPGKNRERPYQRLSEIRKIERLLKAHLIAIQCPLVSEQLGRLRFQLIHIRSFRELGLHGCWEIATAAARKLSYWCQACRTGMVPPGSGYNIGEWRHRRGDAAGDMIKQTRQCTGHRHDVSSSFPHRTLIIKGQKRSLSAYSANVGVTDALRQRCRSVPESGRRTGRSGPIPADLFANRDWVCGHWGELIEYDRGLSMKQERHLERFWKDFVVSSIVITWARLERDQATHTIEYLSLSSFLSRPFDELTNPQWTRLALS